jgi:hypothetical protein
MSGSFKENFERGDREKLDYDDSAFYYFSMSMLLVVLIPATWYMILKPVMFGETSINYSLKNCNCKICIDRLKKRQVLYSYTWATKWFLLRILVLA